MPRINGIRSHRTVITVPMGGICWPVKTIAVKPARAVRSIRWNSKILSMRAKLNERFRADETVETIDLELKDFSFLYAQGDALVFMDLETYDKIELEADWIGERAAFLQEGMKVSYKCTTAVRSASGFPACDPDDCRGRSRGAGPERRSSYKPENSKTVCASRAVRIASGGGSSSIRARSTYIGRAMRQQIA